jgi:hypothetical protein
VSARTTLADQIVAAAEKRLESANAAFARRYPGESGRRQPVHTVYGGAHLFHSDSAARLGALALHALAEFAPGPEALASVLGLARPLADMIYPRVVEKLRREPVEDLRIDFEDGYGNRPDAEEDGHAIAASREVAAGLAAGTLPPAIGIRIKPFTGELSRRSFRTLDVFLTQLICDTGGRLPEAFVVTLAKVTVPEQVAALSDLLEALEGSLELRKGSLHSEIMVETPQAIVSERGAIALLRIVEAGRGRCRAAHFGTYDYTASLAITAAHQHMAHPSCDFARDMMQVALAGTGVWVSDGATNILPIPPHRQAERTLTGREVAENREAVHAAWKLHYGHVRRSLERGYYQGWDLHPAQLPTRYAALYAFFLEELDAASARLKTFVEKAGQATLVGEVFDDAATGQGLLNFFLRAWNCGAITQTEALEKSGLTLEELSGRSFLRILKARQK